jgi:hypothetical protein
MYDLDTRGQLVLADGNFKLVRVLAEDVTIAQAFDVAESFQWPDQVTLDDYVSIFFAPEGRPFVSGEWGPLMYMPDVDNGEDVACFTWGDELVEDEDRGVHGFAMAVWEDGAGPRSWDPQD